MNEGQLRAVGLMVLALAGAVVLHRVAVKQGALAGLSPALVTTSGAVLSACLMAGGVQR